MKTKHLLIVSITLLLSACNSKSPSPSVGLSQPMRYANSEAYQGIQSAPIAPQTVMTPRKIAMTANIDIDVDNNSWGQTLNNYFLT